MQWLQTLCATLLVEAAPCRCLDGLQKCLTL